MASVSDKKYTPGPWRHVDRYQDTAGDIVDKDNFSHVDVCNFSIKMDVPDDEHWSNSKDYHRELATDEQKANANLIAAAPELLEALEVLSTIAECNGWLQATTGRQIALLDAKKAIAKALGG